MNWLFNPAFAQRPPIRLNVNARILGIAVVVLSLLGIPLDLLSLGVLALPAGLLAAYGVANLAFYALASGIALLANIVSLVGGWRLARRHVDGKAWIVVSLVMALLSSLAGLSGERLDIGLASVALTLVVVTILYYLVVVSRLSVAAHQ